MNDDSIKNILFTLDDNFRILNENIYYNHEDVKAFIKKYNEDQKKNLDFYNVFDQNQKTLDNSFTEKQKELKSDINNLKLELKKKVSSSNNSVLTKKDYDSYFNSVNDNINNHLSLFEGFFMGVVIMYIFFSRLFKNV